MQSLIACQRMIKKKGLNMRELNDVLRGKAQRIKLVAMDVDGVLTDGGMYYSESGSEMKKFHSRDGMGIKLLQRLDIITALITSENTKLVQRRADRLAIPEVHQGTFEKDIIIQKLCKKYSILMEDVAFIGDDVNDLEALIQVGFSFAPANAVNIVQKTVDYVCECKGGEGAVREMSDLILCVQTV